MLHGLDWLRELTLLSVMVRLGLAVLCGGVIGLEREYKRRPAGFRTHILICLGACVTTLTSQFLGFAMGYSVDLARLGAQVVAGIGFIGAGTIIVTRQQQVKGLTTAAGLWTCAILGLTVGSGFFEVALAVTAFVLLAELLFVKLEYGLLRISRENILYLEYTGADCLDTVLSFLRSNAIQVTSMEITRTERQDQTTVNAVLYVRLSKKHTLKTLRQQIGEMPGVLLVEQL